jgi:hypothetical protein
LASALRFLGKSQVRSVFIPLQESLDEARAAAKSHYQHLSRTQDNKYLHALRKRDAEVRAAKDQANPQLNRATKTRQAAFELAEMERKRNMSKFETRRDSAKAELDDWLARSLEDLDQRYHNDLNAAKQQHDQRIAAAQREHDEGRDQPGTTLARRPGPHPAHGERRWRRRRRRFHQWQARRAARLVRSCLAHLDASQPVQLARSLWTALGGLEADRGGRSPRWNVQPAIARNVFASRTLAFPRQSSLLIQYDRAGRESAIRSLQMVMTRLLTSIPAGRVRFTIIDPVGLGQNFAGFMHLGRPR